MNATFIHMKDGALCVEAQSLETIPIPEPSIDLKEEIISNCSQIISLRKKDNLDNKSLLLKEEKLDLLIQDAFKITQDERNLLTSSLPPRDPLVILSGVSPEIEAVPIIDTAFPQTEKERVLCTVVLEFIKTSPNRPSVEYLDKLLLATHPDDCRVLIPTSSRRGFDQAVRRLPDEMRLQSGERIGWRRIREYLETARAITITDRSGAQIISPGSQYNHIRATLPTISTNIITFIQEAAQVLEKAQADAQVAAQYGEVVTLFREMADQEMAMTA